MSSRPLPLYRCSDRSMKSGSGRAGIMARSRSRSGGGRAWGPSVSRAQNNMFGASPADLAERVITVQIGRYAVSRFVPSRCRPFTAIALAGASTTRQARHGGPQVRLLGCRLSPPASRGTMRYLTPASSMTPRWPRTGSACRPAIRFRNAGWLRCSDARPAAGPERGSLTHDKHHRSKTRRAPRSWLNCRRWRANSEP
jgi:hypothetical protein